MSIKSSSLIATTFALFIVAAPCFSLPNEVTEDAYAAAYNKKGVVIFAINWARKWKCAGFENAEIMSLGFDPLPIQEAESEAQAQLFLDSPARLLKKPGFVEYALILEPGEYALTQTDVKVARSASDVGRLTANRKNFVPGGEVKSGSFTVAAGETVYIGNFYLDCFKVPMVWRYFTEGEEDFRSHLEQFKQKYPFLDTSKVRYRLFQTKTMGEDYQLPTN